MKKLLLSVAVTALLAGMAHASNSVSTVTQSNTGNSATVDQTMSLIGASSIITQSGADNMATVTQGDDGLALLAPTNTSTIDQIGDNNKATVDQKDSDQTSSIEQISDNNIAEVYQGMDNLGLANTSGNKSTVVQAGGGSNEAYVNQIESDDVMSFVNQMGTEQMADVDQSIVGDRDMSMVDQYGTMQFAEVLQPGDDNTSFVDQKGADNEAWVNQVGNNNMSTILQDMMANDATVTQTTDFNTSMVDQTASTSGTANVSQ